MDVVDRALRKAL